MANANTIVLNANRGTLLIDGQLIKDFVSSDSKIDITYTNDNSSLSPSADGQGGSINRNANRKMGEVTVRVIEHSDSDQILNNLFQNDINVGFGGSYKENFLKDGVQATTTYTFTGGDIKTAPTKTTITTDVNGVMEYVIHFLIIDRI